MRKTLFLGNGFTQSIFKETPSWNDLFKNVDSTIKNYTFLYEVGLLKTEPKTDSDYKKEIVDKIKKVPSAKNIKDILDLDRFGEYLVNNDIHDIITTNYDRGIEFILCKKCGYKEVKPDGLVKEDIYSIRTYKKFVNAENTHQIKLWKIHGDIKRRKTITLGFDQYCGSLSKLSEYIKGTYKSDKGPTCRIPMKRKCKKQAFDNLSWAELFFNTTVYIVGFGLDFSEIDIWWLLNKHKRIKREVQQVQNNIYYLYTNGIDSITEKRGLFEALTAFDVMCYGIDSDEKYIKNIFAAISQLQ